ncbi:glutathione s-transferase, partial [Stylosanthes scabra]|nr:glutathione s-transferase [Stylosanthes scabra]
MAAKSSDLKLLGGWFSPFATRVKIALNIKGLEHENIEEDLNSKSDLLRSNPVYKKIPVLILGEKSICESSIIVQYIDEVWSNNGPAILPQHAYDRAVARFWVSYIDDKTDIASRISLVLSWIYHGFWIGALGITMWWHAQKQWKLLVQMHHCKWIQIVHVNQTIQN